MPEDVAVRHRHRASLLRTLAALTHNETIRATAFALAEDFERMAERAEDHTESGFAPNSVHSDSGGAA